MKCITIHPAGRVEGRIRVQGSKNAALPIMAAAVLNRGFTIIKNCPRITDVDCMALLLTDIGCRVFWQNDMLLIDAKDVNKVCLHEGLAGRIRASVLLMGALMGRMGEVQMPLPGGCRIGARPVDLHIQAMKQLGAVSKVSDDRISLAAAKLIADTINFRYPSVGATENAVIAAVLAQGVTIIKNAALEPEVVALCEALVNMGADISGIGTSEITITGVEELFDSVYEVKPDRIVMGTYIGIAAAAGGTIEFENCGINLGYGYIDAFSGMGLKLHEMDVPSGKNCRSMIVSMDSRPQSVSSIITSPYPGFPTDMQPVAMAVLSLADGESRITEKVFENRFAVADELSKMGADIRIDKDSAYICGVKSLKGCSVEAGDLRASAALLVAACAAQGDTLINNMEYILRGYEDIVRDLAAIGIEAVMRDSGTATTD